MGPGTGISKSGCWNKIGGLLTHTAHKGGYLLLEDGSIFEGETFFGQKPVLGEVIFNTSHSGYQEILTDPSYNRQIMVFTAPHIGNVGINNEDFESEKIQVAGTVIRSLCLNPSNWRSTDAMLSWLQAGNVPLLDGADTRSITLHIRTRGAMRGGIFPGDFPVSRAAEKVNASPLMEGADLTADVTCAGQYFFIPDELDPDWYSQVPNGKGLKVAVLDFGVKKNILRELYRRGCGVSVFSAATPPDHLLEGDFHGLLISNGPGDPAAVEYGIKTIREMIGRIPIFGICLGHQLLALSAGLSTYKMPFGHRGSNHPVMRMQDKTIEITSQNHGFAVNPDGLPPEWEITHINLNDGTVEGIRHRELPMFSIQYHPEASPGPHEGKGYFDQFIRDMLQNA